MDDNVEILRRYNRWRRGQSLWSATADLPDPRVVGEAIDAACDEIERLRAEISTAEAFHKVAVAERNYERQRADILESATIKALEDRDRLRAELAECKRDAERYRWLRGTVPESSSRWARWRLECWISGAWHELRGLHLDTCIDAALAAKGDE